MQGKLLFSQSLSTFLFLNLFSMKDDSQHRESEGNGSILSFPVGSYLLKVKSAFVSPETVRGFD